MPISTSLVKYRVTLLFALLLFLTACTLAGEDPGGDKHELQGRAVKISDGDTFDLLSSNEQRTIRIRLHGVDCPERGMDYARVAKESLGELLRDQRLRVVAVDSDRYGRVVGDVYTTNGTWVNLELVERGMAWHYTDYSSDQRLAGAERKARAARLRLWSQPQPVAPWEWRRAKRSGGAKKQKGEERVEK